MPPAEPLSGEVTFHFEKSNFFRVIHVDGAFGGLLPNASGIQMAVYSERSPLPKMVVHSAQDGALGAEIIDKRVVREGVFREVEASLSMSLDTAMALRDWLSGRINELTVLRNGLAQSQSSQS